MRLGQKIGELVVFEKNTFSNMIIRIGLDSISAKKKKNLFLQNFLSVGHLSFSFRITKYMLIESF